MDGASGASSGAADATAPQPISADVHRLAVTDLVAGGATVILLVSLLLPWYTLRPNASMSISIGALVDPAAGFRVLILVGCMALLGYLASRIVAAPAARSPIPHWQVLTAVAAFDAFLALLGLLVRPSGLASGVSTLVGTGIGAYIGLVFACVALAGAVLRAWQPERVDARSWADLQTLSGHPVPVPVPWAEGGGPAPSASDERQCPSCGAPLGPGNRFCIQCGTLIVP